MRILCPECDAGVSQRAAACRRCGFPIRELSEEQIRERHAAWIRWQENHQRERDRKAAVNVTLVNRKNRRASAAAWSRVAGWVSVVATGLMLGITQTRQIVRCEDQTAVVTVSAPAPGSAIDPGVEMERTTCVVWNRFTNTFEQVEVNRDVPRPAREPDQLVDSIQEAQQVSKIETVQQESRQPVVQEPDEK